MAKPNEDNNSNSQTSNNDHPVVEESQVAYKESLARLGGDVELFKEFVNIFYEDSPPLLNKMFVSVDAADHDGVARSAHALKGLVSNFGAKPCCDLALEYELAGKNETSESMAGKQEKMQLLYDQLCDELKQYTD